jgi:hypothetical protein
MKKIKNIKDPWIAREKFDNISNIKTKLSHLQWVEYIEDHQDYFTWYEDTPDGIYRKNNMDKVPDSFKEKVLYSLNKHKVFAEFNKKKGWYEIVIGFNDELNVIGTTFMKPIKKEHLRRLLDMANCLDALLLNHGDEIIDEKVIEGLE